MTLEDLLPYLDGAGFVGTSAHWKRRTGYTYSATNQSVFKYIGSAGAR